MYLAVRLSRLGKSGGHIVSCTVSVFSLPFFFFLQAERLVQFQKKL